MNLFNRSFARKLADYARYRLLPYDAAKAKALNKERRQQDFRSEAWSHSGALSQRKYDSYEDYVRQQSKKVDEIRETLVGSEQKSLESFVKRFSSCAYLSESRSVLCLGARLGAEVKALIELGHFAVGIDLNPGPDNAYVLPGDFHQLVFADNTIDAIYTNCLDHLFDLKEVTGEMRRVIRPGGRAIVDIVKGYEEGYTAGPYEAAHWPTAEAFATQLSDTFQLPLKSFRSLSDQGAAEWYQAVYSKELSPQFNFSE